MKHSMKISNKQKNDSIYLQKKDIIYLEKILNKGIVPVEQLKKYNNKDFILVEGKEKVQLINTREEILEFRDFLAMTRKQAEQRMDDAEQFKYITERYSSSSKSILRANYEYESAVDEYLEKGRGILSFDVPLTLDMLNDYLFYRKNDTYYAASTQVESTYQIGRNDGKIINYFDPAFTDFAESMIQTTSEMKKKDENTATYYAKMKSADKKKLYYTINRKK